jgi:CRP/FNR family transcriptional regulator
MSESTNTISSPHDGEIEQRRVVHFPPGTLLVTEGDASRKMFIIKSGKARVFRKYLGQRITLAILGDGEIFGEMSFFDGSPRSASVETLTELSAIVIDGAKGQKQIADLPDWVHTIFRTVAARFRRLDQQVTMLQSVYDFQKKSFKTDNCSRTIYTEILRFIKTTTLLCEHRMTESVALQPNEIVAEAEGLLGNRYLSFQVFWNLLREHEFISNDRDEKNTPLCLNIPRLLEFERYIEKGIAQESFPILSHTALAVLRRIAAQLSEEESHSTEEQKMPTDQLNLHDLFNVEDAFLQLSQHKTLFLDKENITFVPETALNTYTWQTILKNFDYTTIAID